MSALQSYNIIRPHFNKESSKNEGVDHGVDCKDYHKVDMFASIMYLLLYSEIGENLMVRVQMKAKEEKVKS